MAMTDPLQALVSLQVEIRKGTPTRPTEKYPSIRVVLDERNGRVRYTYARVDYGRVKAMAIGTHRRHPVLSGWLCRS